MADQIQLNSKQQNILQINKFSHLHDGKVIFFSKTDFLLHAFKIISSFNNEVILISGNSDYCIDDKIAELAPKNIKRWFCQNRLSDNPILESIPIGMENTLECKIDGHGYVWPHAKEKPSLIIREMQNERPKANLIYSNFNISTNPRHRQKVKQLIAGLPYVTDEPPKLSYGDFVRRINEHEAVLCPQGNGLGDNHRIYESLYLGKTPITFNPIQYKYLHHKFPVVLLEKEEDIRSEALIRDKIEAAKSVNFDPLILNFEYWKAKIFKCI